MHIGTLSKNFLKAICLYITLVSPVIAAPILTITPSTTSILLPKGGQSTFNINISNTSGQTLPISSIVFKSSIVELQKLTSNCSQLANNSNCSEIISVSSSKVGADSVDVQACLFNGTICTASNSKIEVITSNTTSSNFLTITEQPSFPGYTTVNGNVFFRYQLKNNSSTQSASLSNVNINISSGQLVKDTTRSTCDTSIAANSTCWLAYRYTAPNSQGTATGIISINYGGSEPLNLTNLSFNFQRETRAMISNSATASVTHCLVNNTTGTFSDCQNISSLNLNNPIGMKLNPAMNKLFIVNNGSNNVTRCAINKDSYLISNCNTLNAPSLNQPVDFIYNANQSHAFFSNNGNSSITKCDMNAVDGSFSNCVDSGATTLNQPAGMVFNKMGTKIIATNNNIAAANLSYCSVNTTTGLISNCTNVSSNVFGQPGGVTLNLNGDQILVADGVNNNVILCYLSNNGVLSHCRDSGATGLNAPQGIKYNADGSRAYITNFNANSVTTCNVSASTGFLSECQNAGATALSSPYEIMLNDQTTLN